MRNKLLLIGVALGLLGTAAIMSALQQRRGTWELMVDRVDELEAERLARSIERGALYGETISGRAWAHYEAAAEAAGNIQIRGLPAHVVTADDTESAKADRQVLLTEADTVLAQLRLGAHANRVVSPFEQRSMHDWPDIHGLTTAMHVAEAAALALLESGDDIEAVRVTLDVQQLAADLLCGSALIEQSPGAACLVPSSFMRAVGPHGAALTREARIAWADGLDRLAHGRSWESRALRGELERTGRSLASNEANDPGVWTAPGRLAGWRFGFSANAAGADYVVRGTDWARQIESAGEQGEEAAVAMLHQSIREMADDPNPFVRDMMSAAARRSVARWSAMARLSYLRHALALDLGRPLETPMDPFGIGVRVDVDDEVVSVGTTGPSGAAAASWTIAIRRR